MPAFTLEKLRVQTSPTRAEMGRLAGEHAVHAILEALARHGSARIILASAPSQSEMLATLLAAPIDWARVTIFHMDEYLGLPAGHPQTFRAFQQAHVLSKITPAAFHGIAGESTDPTAECARYAALLAEGPIHLCCLGIGENGHLAFNDPPVADFADPVAVKVVELDTECRQQQVNDGCFPTLAEVPTHALTLTIPALMRAESLVCTVPGPRKAGAVKATLRAEVSTAYPASILRQHGDATLYLDDASAGDVQAFLRYGSEQQELRDFRKMTYRHGVILGTAVGFAMELIGYLMVRGDRSNFGWVMFLLVPIVAGFCVAAVVRAPLRSAACAVTGSLLMLSILLFTGWEGIICCLMAAPLVALGLLIGGFLGYVVRGRYLDRDGRQWGKAFVILLCPLIIAAADRAERPFREQFTEETFTTEMLVDATPERTWALVASMEKLDGPQPLLLRMGLPVPARCELSQSAVGGERVCYFNQGKIVQSVTQWDEPVAMDLKVTENTLPGRHWLTFVSARYDLSASGAQTKIVRQTTIKTRLYPRWYWRPLERWGVTSEHDFVFANLRRWTEAEAKKKSK
jgi:glucosamine-6-phosphate deaminase